MAWLVLINHGHGGAKSILEQSMVEKQNFENKRKRDI